MQDNSLLSIKSLSVSVLGNPILENVSLIVAPGTIHAVMGPNGSGKSTLAYAIMGHPHYEVTAGSLYLKNDDISKLSPDKRAQKGLFLSFQHPFEIPGVSVSSFLKEAYNAIKGTTISSKDFQQLLLSKMEQLGIDFSFASRGLNDGFSGGEKKKLELLQLLILQPKVAILDEIDSGLDIDALKTVAWGLEQARIENPAMSILIITHYQRILQYIVPNYVHVLSEGQIVDSGNATIAQDVELKGYNVFKKPTQQSAS